MAAPPSDRLSRARLSQSDRDVLIHLSCPLSLSSYPVLRLFLLCLPPPFPFAKRPAVHVRYARAFKFTLDDQCCSSNRTHDHPITIRWLSRTNRNTCHFYFQIKNQSAGNWQDYQTEAFHIPSRLFFLGWRLFESSICHLVPKHSIVSNDSIH